MSSDSIHGELARRLRNAFCRLENCCDYLFDLSDGLDGKYAMLSADFGAAASQIGSVLEDGVWANEADRNDTLHILNRGSKVYDAAGLPFLRREVQALISEIEIIQQHKY